LLRLLIPMALPSLHALQKPVLASYRTMIPPLPFLMMLMNGCSRHAMQSALDSFMKLSEV
jgi:hypothetical protein